MRKKKTRYIPEETTMRIARGQRKVLKHRGKVSVLVSKQIYLSFSVDLNIVRIN